MHKSFDEQKQLKSYVLWRYLLLSGKLAMIASVFSLQAFTGSLYAADENHSASMSGVEIPGKISGTVYDSSGGVVIGASVTQKGTTNGTITDINGRFSLDVNSRETALEVSFVGYKTASILANINQLIQITLQEDSELLDEIVVVGYGTQKRTTMTAAVSSVKGEAIAKLPTPRMSTGIGGQVAGVVTFQESGAPGSDAAKIYVRGNADPLVLVDGVERPGDRVNMQDVESISVLKDASAVAPYGLKGANGVILITTKRGVSGVFSVSYTGEASWQKPMNTPEFMGSADYFEFRNKAYEMDGLTGQIMSGADVALYRNGTDPDRYPNTDWVKNYMKTSMANRQNVTIIGGSDKIRAFASLGYVNQGSMFNGQDYERYTFRGNVDIQATPTTKISIDNSLMKDILTRDGLGADQIMDRLYTAVPYEVDRYSNGLSAYQSSVGVSLYEAMHNRGTYKEMNDITTNNISIEQLFPFLPGLSGKLSFNYDKQHKDLKEWTLPLVWYSLTPEGEYERIDQSETTKPSLSQEYKRWDWYTFNGSLSYGNTFGKHQVGALALFEARWTDYKVTTTGKSETDFLIPELNTGTTDREKWSLGGTSSQERQYGVVGRFNYSYDQKYLIELAGRYDGSYKYAPGKRTAFFPSASVGWRISEEPFMAFSRRIVDNLKLRASHGKSGNPVGSAYSYMSTYSIGNSYAWGTSGIREQGLYASVEANPNLTWETVRKTDIGFELNMWKGLLGLEVDYFYEKRNDKILAPNAEVPVEYGIKLADENAGIDTRNGVDITIANFTNVTKSLKIQNSFVFTYSHQKLLENHENQGTLYNPRKRQTGYAASQIWGYLSDGLFQDEEEIKNWAFQDAGTKPGDIKYKDINGDGKIDSEDIVHIGRSMIPEIMWGYNFRAEWKGFDVSLFFQGTGNSNYYLDVARVRIPFYSGKARVEHYDSWTTDNPNPNAKYPRLRSTSFAKNYECSDFWVINSSYIKLKSIDLGYSFKQEWSKKVGMSKLRVYANFYNVWTIFSKASKDFDPESQKYSAYPQQFISTVGLSATF